MRIDIDGQFAQMAGQLEHLKQQKKDASLIDGEKAEMHERDTKNTSELMPS